MQKLFGFFVVAFIALAGFAQAEDRWMAIPEPPAMPQATESGYAPVNGIQMYYAVYGAGDPVLLIHGGLGHADIWANQVIELAKTQKVIIADSRGHGRSTRDEKPYGYHLMASDYLALLDFLKVDKTALVGWSDGGIIGLDIAMHHPERLTKLFAFGANYNVGGLRADIGGSKVFNAYIEEAGKDYAKLSKTPTEYEAFVNQIAEMWNTQPDYKKEELQAITVPTVIAVKVLLWHEKQPVFSTKRTSLRWSSGRARPTASVTIRPTGMAMSGPTAMIGARI